MSVQGTLSLAMQVTQTATVGLGTTSNVVSKNVSLQFTDGTGANQLNVLWSATRTATAAVDTLDLNGVLTDAYGANVDLLRVKGLYIRNTSTTDGQNLKVGGAAANAWATMFGTATDKLQVGPSGFFFNVAPLATGFPVTAGTGDQLQLDPGSNTITYEIAVLGCNA